MDGVRRVVARTESQPRGPEGAWQDRGRLRVHAGKPTRKRCPHEKPTLEATTPWPSAILQGTDTRSTHTADESQNSFLKERRTAVEDAQGRQSSEEVGDEHVRRLSTFCCGSSPCCAVGRPRLRFESRDPGCANSRCE